jgi:hypothetical protein
VSSYIGLDERHGYLQILQEYIPTPLAQKLVEKAPKAVLQKILSLRRTFEQEWSYTFLYRSVENKIFNLPKLAEQEELERVMIAYIPLKSLSGFWNLS